MDVNVLMSTLIAFTESCLWAKILVASQALCHITPAWSWWQNIAREGGNNNHAGGRDCDFYLVTAHTDTVLMYKKFDFTVW